MGLTAATALAENAAALLDGIVADLQVQGLDIEHRESTSPASASAGALLREAELGWACGLLTTDLLAEGLEAEIVAAPVFEGEVAPVYHSVIVARRSVAADLGDLAGGRLVVNEPESWSGHWALAAHLIDRGFAVDALASVERSGSHRQSLAAVARGDADLAAIDHSLWAHLAREPESHQLEAVDRTRDWPAPPFVVSTRLVEELRSPLIAALLAIDAQALPGLQRIVPATSAPYTVLHEARAVLPSLL